MKNKILLFILLSNFTYSQIGTSMSKTLENPYQRTENLPNSNTNSDVILANNKNDTNISIKNPNVTSKKEINSTNIFNKNYDDLNGIEKIELKSIQLKEEQEKLKRQQELLNKKRFVKNKQNDLEILDEQVNDYDKIMNQSDFSDYSNIILDSELNALKSLYKNNKIDSKNNLAKKQITLLNNQNKIIKNELIGLLNPAEYIPNESSISLLKKNNAEMQMFFMPYGLKMFNPGDIQKSIYDLISLNYALKTKLIELLRMSKDQKFNQSLLEEFFYSSEILMNFSYEE